MTAPWLKPRPQACLRPELAACFAIRRSEPASPAPAPMSAPLAGVLAELARYGRP